MAKTHTCPACGTAKHSPELNDDTAVTPKIKLDELVRISDHGTALFRVMKMDGSILELEKI
jgi:hypothetical protein